MHAELKCKCCKHQRIGHWLKKPLSLRIAQHLMFLEYCWIGRWFVLHT